MNKKNPALLFIGMIVASAFAQNPEKANFNSFERTPEPFLFSVTTLTPQDLKWSLNYSSSYGERVEGPFGYDGVSQQFSVKGYLGSQFTLYADAALGISHVGDVTSAQQVEIIRDILGGKKNTGIRLGIGLGVNNDFSNAKSLLSRITASFNTPEIMISGNMLFEHTFTANRDAVDVITNLGFHYHLTGNLSAGFEAVGEDLEGFWDKEEAEGGAKLMVGPSLNFNPRKSGISFAISGGPVIYATRNQLTNPDAVRELPSQSGLILRASILFKLPGS